MEQKRFNNLIKLPRKYTPGPWVVGKSHTSDVAIREPDGECVAVCCDSLESEVEANGKIVASAPHLLSALIEANETLIRTTGYSSLAAEQAIDEALLGYRFAD